MDLVRSILIASEEGKPHVDHADWATLHYHLLMMKEAGLVDVSLLPSGGPTRIAYAIRTLTWQGHELLDAIRDDSIWSKAKREVLKEGASWTVEVLKAWATNEIKTRLGI